MKRRNLMSSMVNPFVVLADVAIMTTFILFIYLITQSLLLSKGAFELRSVQKQQEKVARQLQTVYKNRWGKSVNEYHKYNLQRFTFADNVLFDSGVSTLKLDAKKVLAPFAAVIRPQIRLHPDMLLTVEGHTDRVPLHRTGSQQGYSNWELSTDRALSVVRYLQDEGSIDAGHMVASGRGEYDSARGSADRKDPSTGRYLPNPRNRRIEIVVKYANSHRE